MNNKTAKLISKFASHTEEDKKALKRRWMEMSQDARRRFRRQMQVTVNADSAT